ncbi:MAG: ParB/RepB/Spo0J family partition protein [Clostridia bacterium]|nr:ParB/RepB/Spo0J family partition protein [Clostridia bacterium]
MKELSLAELKPFEGHPYKVRDDEEMDALIESIREHRIMVPLMVRPIDAGYEIISGHRRAHAAISAGLKTVPVVGLDISRDEAAVALVDSNLHREHILPSEKAFAYKLKLDALSRQGKRTDLTSTQVVEKLTTAQLVGESNLESRETVRRYIRLTHLNPTLLRLVDEGRIAFTPAVELSYLSEEEQDMLSFEIAAADCTPSLYEKQQMCVIIQVYEFGNVFKLLHLLDLERKNSLEVAMCYRPNNGNTSFRIINQAETDALLNLV